MLVVIDASDYGMCSHEHPPPTPLGVIFLSSSVGRFMWSMSTYK